MKKRIASLLLCFVLALSLLPTAAFAGSGTAQTGKATLVGFAAGSKAGDAYIQNNGMTILDATGTDGNNPKYSESKVGQTAILSPYCPPYGMTIHPKYVYNDYNATSIIVQNEDGSGTQRRLLTGDTFKPGMTYRFTFQDTSWPVNRSIKGGGYLGELTNDNFTIEGAEVVKVKRVAQRLNLAEDYEMQGFFYNVWIKINDTQNDYKVQYADHNVTVDGLEHESVSSHAVTGYAKEGTKITLTADKVKSGGYIFTGWKFTTSDGKVYMDKDYIQWYCNVTDYASSEGGSDRVTCSFRMGDKDIGVEALYSTTGKVTINAIELNIMPPIKGGQPFTVVEPVYDSAIGAAYRVDEYKWYDTASGLASGYTMKPTSVFTPGGDRRYALTVTLKLNDRYVFDTTNPTVTINGQKYEKGKEDTGAYRLHEALCVGGFPVSYWYFGKTDPSSKTLTLTIPLDADTHDWLYDPNSAADFRPYAALKFADPLTAAITVDDETAEDNQFTVEQGSHTVALNVTVPKDICDRIGDGTVSLVPAILGLYQDSLAGENLWASNPDHITRHSDGSCTYTYSTGFRNAEVGHTYLPIGAVNLVSTGPEVQYLTSASAGGSIQVTPAKTISGNITYTSAVRYNGLVQTGIVVKVGEEYVPANGYSYQWQRKDGSGWTDIAGGDKKQYTPVAADVGKEIRLVINGTNGYTGMIVGGAKVVAKAVESGYPARPQLTAIKDGEDYTGFEIVYFDPDKYEYVYSQNDKPNWNTDTEITSKKVTGLDAGQTYNVFVRYRATDTTEAGTGVSFNSVTLTDIMHLSKLVLSDTDGEYAPFGDGNTIYVKADEEKTLTVTANPSGANTWEAFTFRPDNNTSDVFEVTQNASVAASTMSGAVIPLTITIKGGLEARTETLVAARGGVGSYYGRWKVVVYTDEKIPSFEITKAPTFGDVTLTVGETQQPDNIPDISAITTKPAGALSGYTLKWEVYTGEYSPGTGYPTGTSNSAIEVNENGTVTAKAPTTEDWQKVVCLVATDGSHTPHFIASYRVSVNAKEPVALVGIEVTPKTLKLKVGEEFNLVAAKIPVNTDDMTAFNWGSSADGIAAVDSAGKVTAVAEGKATITATCGSFSAICEVTVIAPDHTHNVTSWSKFSETQHIGSCTTCGTLQYADHTWTESGTSSDESYDYTHYICTDCGAARTEATVKSDSGPVSISYAITVKDTKNGDVIVNRKRASAGTTVTITVKPDSGYVLDELTVTNAKDKTIKLIDKGNGKYTFTMPSSKVTVEASFSKIKVENPFVDVKPGSYYEDAVIWAVGAGITTGTPTTTFDPDATCDRAQAVTLLWRAVGSPAPKSTTMPFTDVPVGSYYYDAVLWAVENGITNGTSATTFSPGASCSRAQIITFLWRVRKSPATAAANPFADVAVGTYYTNAVLWAVEEGVTKGTTSTTFSPDADCTRAQIVTFIYRALAE